MTSAPERFRGWFLPAGLEEGWEPGESVESGGVEVSSLRPDPVRFAAVARSLAAKAEALRRRPVREIVAVLGAVGARFLDPADPLRARALAALPATSGLSPGMASAVLDGMAADWTGEALERVVAADFPQPGALDGFVEEEGRRVRALGPSLCVQVLSGSVPGVGATALLRSLLVKAPTLLKPGRGDVVLPVLLAEAVAEADPELGSGTAVVYWPGGSTAAESAALAGAELVVAYGSDAAVSSLRARTPVHVPFVPYHHRVSVGVVGREALVEEELGRLASSVAGALAYFDQRGCVSPQLIWVEEGGQVSPRAFAERLAKALEAVEGHLPGGTLDEEEASALHQLRGTAELLAASGGGVELRHGGEASWTVVYDPGSALDLACVGRVARIRPVDDVVRIPALAEPFRGHLQTVAVAGVEKEARARLVEELAAAGASRITTFDASAFPPPGWHHDGRGALSALVRWVDLEG